MLATVVRGRLQQLGVDALPPPALSVSTSPHTPPPPTSPPRVFSRSPQVRPPSRAIPGLNFSDPLDAVGLSDDEQTEIRKLGANDIREDSHPSLEPPIRPTVEPQLGQLKQQMPMSPRISELVRSPTIPAAGKAAQEAASATQQPPGKQAPASSTHKPQKQPVSKPSPYSDIRVMVVDDSEVNKKLLCKLLAMVRNHAPAHS